MPGETPPPSMPGIGARRAAVVSCWLCGIRLHASRMVPDGGSACEDIRWYCKDTRACTQRWTTSRRVLAATGRGGQDERADDQLAGRDDDLAAVSYGASATP